MDYSERRIASDAEIKLIGKFLRQLYVINPKTKLGKWVDPAWSDEALAKALSDKFEIVPPLTLWNVRNVRQKKAKKFTKTPTLPDILKPTPKLAPAPKLTDEAPKSNFFKSITERFFKLEARVAELEDVVTRPMKQLELPLPELPEIDNSTPATSDLEEMLDTWGND